MVQPIRVGVIGASAERGWALGTHLPVLRRSPEYGIVAVAGSTMDKAAAAATVWDAPHAFDDPHRLINHPDVDLVCVVVPVPRRDGLVPAAIAAGKHVYCEWPLAADAAEAAGFQDAATTADVRNVVGLQGRHHPAVRHLRDLLADGWVGEPLSASLSFTLSTPDGPWPQRYKKLIAGKATSRLLIVGGHAIDLFRTIVGDFTELSATVATRIPFVELAESGERVPVPAPDQIAVTGVLSSGAVGVIHIVTGSPRGDGYRMEVYGRAGRLVLVSDRDDLIGPRFTLSGSRDGHDLAPIALPDRYLADLIDAPPAIRNVHRVYTDLAMAIRTGGPVAPDFATGTGLHQLLEAIETAALTGRSWRHA